MRQKTETALDSILGDHSTRHNLDRRQQRKLDQEPESFRKRWDKKIETTVMPVFEEFKAKLQSKKHWCDIVVQDQQMENGDYHCGDATFFAVPKKHRDQELAKTETPFVSYTVETRRKIIIIYKSTVLGRLGGSEGPNGELHLEEISKASVEDALLRFIEQVFSK